MRPIDVLERMIVQATLEIAVGTNERRTAEAMRDGISEIVRRVEDGSEDLMSAVSFAVGAAAAVCALLRQDGRSQFFRDVAERTTKMQGMLDDASQLIHGRRTGCEST